MSDSTIPNPKACDLYDLGHVVFWLKSIKTIEYPRQLCEIRIQDSKSLILTTGSEEMVMFNHQVPRLSAILNQANILVCEFCPETGYLYLFHDEGQSYVFSLSETPLRNCEVDLGILRF